MVVFAYPQSMKIGERIKRFRQERGRTQTWLADAIGVKQHTISGWEKSRTTPSREDTRKIAVALNVDISQLELGDHEIEAQSLRLMGYIGAGQAVVPFADQDNVEPIPAPPGCPPGAEAAIVRGGSMLPFIKNGSMIIWWQWSEDPAEFVGETCVCRLKDGGGMLVKDVERGSKRGVWTLHSTTAGYEPIRDVALAGVAPVEMIIRRPRKAKP